ncbi:lytic transglycosylase [Scytonema sp. HK-05]|uniref:lytic transglycosylase domain-containing protein n=1 Tax=Scytonema sp. HK-05 TaxID=1137095 RepID=UPI0009358448|nr:transglycosylase SLT domain-containing protein [Scytonema sp. HK-05]OKH58387.1 tail length tape measure protein [Scytonema sp. HK-05]BAY43993.1 lytic transglycosylase [Scytonema sp. HK-05]
MLKKLQTKHISLIAGAGLCAFLAGAIVSAPEIGKSVGQWLKPRKIQPEQLSEESKAKSPVFALVSQSPQERAAKLEALKEGAKSADRNRARYLLASDLIERKQAKPALELLKGLEKDYPLLAPYVLLKQAQAEELLGEEGKASDLRQKVVKEYPKQAAAAKALYLIALPEYQDKAIAEFPSHPLTWEIIRKRLQENPNQPQLQLVLAKYAYDQLGIVPVLDQLANNSTLKPEEWEIIGTAYWENSEFGKAATAYGKATRTPQNYYRVARGLQVGGQRAEAVVMYQQLVKTFPDAKETGTALMRLAEMATVRKDALPYLNQVISKFPDKAGTALVEKIKILQTQDQKAASEALKLLLTKYGNSEEAAEYRWKMAQQKAKAKDYKAAWQWAEPIPKNNPNSILAPRAGFWVAKWASKLGKNQEAKQAFEYTISNFPYSYYSWRAAATLGLNVGNFNTVRKMNPQVVPIQRPLPTAGSETFKELYLLGQDRDAWLQWQTEFQNKMQPTVAEEFTDGLMQLAKGENIKGIDQISKLEDRETPQEQAEYQALSKQITYWQARYPFPYLKEIETWSEKRQLNPLLVTALIRQESRFETKARSTAGATGLMQVLPNTAKWIAPQIQFDTKKIDLQNPNDNIMFGTWYLDHTHQQYGNNSLLAIASYNAGPGNVSKWLPILPKEDPDEFVESIPFDETKNYVRQVFGNYWNYLRLYNPEISQIVSKYSAEHPELPLQ